MPLQGSLSIERMCQLAGVSRAGFYRSLQDRTPVEEVMEVRSVIQQIAVEHRRRGRHLYPFEEGVRLPGVGSGRVFPQGTAT